MNICALNCGKTGTFIMSSNQEGIACSKKGFYFHAHLQMSGPSDSEPEDHSAGISKATSVRHQRVAGGRQSHAQKESLMDTADKKKITDAYRTLFIIHIEPFIL